jgi:hypothetical protein
MKRKYDDQDNKFIEYVENNEGVERLTAIEHSGLKKKDFNLMIKRLTVVSCGAITPIRKGGIIEYYTSEYAKENGITRKSFIKKTPVFEEGSFRAGNKEEEYYEYLFVTRSILINSLMKPLNFNYYNGVTF